MNQIDVLQLKNEVRRIGNEVMKLYHSNLDVQDKKDASPVTEADLLSNKLLIEVLEKTGIPILSEEVKDSAERLDSEMVWVIDPLDGTKDFIQKTDEFSIMVGLVNNGEPILGIVYAPALEKLYYAEKSRGAFLELGVGSWESGDKEKCHSCESGNLQYKGNSLNQMNTYNETETKDPRVRKDDKPTPQKLQVSKKDDYKDWTILVSRNHLGEEEVKLAESLEFRAKRPTGSIGVKLGLIAEGEAEIYLHAIDKTWEWDVAAAEIILKEAGGMVTDVDGNQLDFNKEIPKNFKGILATNNTRHQEIVEELGE